MCIRERCIYIHLGGYKLPKQLENKIHNMRNAILHSEEEILDGNISEGEPWFVCFYDKKVAFNKIEITHYELANHLCSLYQLGSEVISKLPNESNE